MDWFIRFSHSLAFWDGVGDFMDALDDPASFLGEETSITVPGGDDSTSCIFLKLENYVLEILTVQILLNLIK